MLIVSRSLNVRDDISWVVHVNGHRVEPDNVPSIARVPPLLEVSSIVNILQFLSQLKTCIGNTDSKCIEMAKTKKNAYFLSCENDVPAYLKTCFPLMIDSQQYLNTVRTATCRLLSTEPRCCNCTKYHSTLIAMSFRQKRLWKGATQLQIKERIFFEVSVFFQATINRKN